jgi:hypothetical protein
MALAPIVTAGSVLTATNFNALPRGVVQVAAKTTDQTGISTQADISSLSVTWTAVSGRYYRISVYLASVRQRTSGGIVVLNITDASNVSRTQQNVTLATDDFSPLVAVEVSNSLSGSITRKARIGTTAGTVDVPSATSPAGWYIMVEDLGTA